MRKLPPQAGSAWNDPVANCSEVNTCVLASARPTHQGFHDSVRDNEKTGVISKGLHGQNFASVDRHVPAVCSGRK